MRSSYWLVIGAIVAAALAIAYWPSGSHHVSRAPPGQYPLHETRPEWSATQSVGLYRPRGSDKFQDSLAPSSFMDAKMACGFGRVHGEEVCTRPTVPLGPQYEPHLLQSN